KRFLTPFSVLFLSFFCPFSVLFLSFFCLFLVFFWLRISLPGSSEVKMPRQPRIQLDGWTSAILSLFHVSSDDGENSVGRHARHDLTARGIIETAVNVLLKQGLSLFGRPRRFFLAIHG